jgi:uncharacterized protein (TIGR02246 family)
MSGDEKAIRDVVTLWLKATTEGDIVTIMNLMTEDVVFLTPGNPPMMREAFRTGFENMIRSVKVKPSSKVQEVTIEGNLATTWAAMEVELTPLSGGPKKVAKGHTLSAFRRGGDGQWRIFRDANMLSAFAQK